MEKKRDVNGLVKALNVPELRNHRYTPTMAAKALGRIGDPRAVGFKR